MVVAAKGGIGEQGVLSGGHAVQIAGVVQQVIVVADQATPGSPQADRIVRQDAVLHIQPGLFAAYDDGLSLVVGKSAKGDLSC